MSNKQTAPQTMEGIVAVHPNNLEGFRSIIEALNNEGAHLKLGDRVGEDPETHLFTIHGSLSDLMRFEDTLRARGDSTNTITEEALQRERERLQAIRHGEVEFVRRDPERC